MKDKGLASTNQNAGIKSTRIVCLFTHVGSRRIVHLNLGLSNIPVAHHKSWCATANFLNYF